jgi:hypothetical protein
MPSLKYAEVHGTHGRSAYEGICIFFFLGDTLTLLDGLQRLDFLPRNSGFAQSYQNIMIEYSGLIASCPICKASDREPNGRANDPWFR